MNTLPKVKHNENTPLVVGKCASVFVMTNFDCQLDWIRNT